MLINPKFGRRLFLGSVSSAAAAIPFLRSFPLHAHGGEGALPKVLFVGFPNGPLVGPNGGNTYDGWRPEGFAGNESVLPQSLPHIFEPLNDHRDRLVFLEGLSYLEAGNPHRATTSLLTGRLRHNPGDLAEYTSTGPSVDHVLAQELGTNVLNTAYYIAGYGSVGESYWSFSGPGTRVLPHQDPADTYNAVFGAGLDESAAEALLSRRTSVLDAIAGDISTMKTRVPAADRERLDAHFDAIRALEEELIATSTANCETPGASPEYANHEDNAVAPSVFRDHASIITQSFACGHSRVATLQFGSFGGDRMRPNWADLGVETSNTEHAICHEFAGDPPVGGAPDISQNAALQFGLQKERAFSQLFAEVLDGLELMTDIDGKPLLDNTLVIYVRPMGQNHDATNVLWIAAGGAGVNVSGGRFLHVGGGADPRRYYNDVLTTVCNTMGYPTEGFGDPNFCGTPINLS